MANHKRIYRVYAEAHLQVRKRLKRRVALGRGDVPPTLVETILNQVLEAQIREHLGADRYERTEEREGYRNGFRERQLATRVGPLTLRVPQTRDGSFSTDIFECYRCSEQAFVLDGNGRERRIDTQGHAYYGGVMRYVIFEIDRQSSNQGAG